MELALGSWPWSPVLKVNTSWIFVFFFALFKLIYFNFIIQIFFLLFFLWDYPNLMLMIVDYVSSPGLTWFFCCFLKIVFFLQFHSSIFDCLVIQMVSGLVLSLIFHCFFCQFIYCCCFFLFILFKLLIEPMT